ncbi:MAG: class I SAM-dependent methyltransferase [Desulfobacteraceae bacterium]|nr:class I SAM-dependent methyltransferase [Desulfobacteraceae bacterium]
MSNHTCPIWIGHILASPLRKLLENPAKILKPHINEGMTVLDIGSAMGFFSLPVAKMVTPKGKVICIDLQQKMLDALMKRATKAGIAETIETRLAEENTLKIDDLKETVDVAIAYHVVHEVNNQELFLTETFSTLKHDGKLIFSEPRGHVSKADFDNSLSIAEKIGFKISNRPGTRRACAALLEKQ